MTCGVGGEWNVGSGELGVNVEQKCGVGRIECGQWGRVSKDGENEG